jgi:hypothetical protein
MSVKSHRITKDATAKRFQGAPAMINRVRGFSGNHTVLRKQSATRESERLAGAVGQQQHACACVQTAGSGQCSNCGSHPRSLIQRAAIAAAPTRTGSPIVNEVLSASGHALDAPSRSLMETRFGQDFSDVRVHTDEKAAESADAVDALAYTVGRQVVFGPGQYAPETGAGQRLLAHELAHVVQQGPVSPQLRRRAIEAGGGGSDLEQSGSRPGVILRRPKPKGTPKRPKPKAKAKRSPLTAAEVQAHIISNNKSSASTELLLCLIWKESSFDPKEKSSTSSATGLMQLTKPAVTQVNKSSPKGTHFTHGEMTDPAKNIQCGTYYLKIRTDWAGGDLKKGLEGFGTGSGYADNILACEACIKATPADTDACLKSIHS